MKFVRKGHKVGRIRKDGMEESGGCLWAGIFEPKVPQENVGAAGICRI